VRLVDLGIAAMPSRNSIQLTQLAFIFVSPYWAWGWAWLTGRWVPD